MWTVVVVCEDREAFLGAFCSLEEAEKCKPTLQDMKLVTACPIAVRAKIYSKRDLIEEWDSTLGDWDKRFSVVSERRLWTPEHDDLHFNFIQNAKTRLELHRLSEEHAVITGRRSPGAKKGQAPGGARMRKLLQAHVKYQRTQLRDPRLPIQVGLGGGLVFQAFDCECVDVAVTSDSHDRLGWLSLDEIADVCWQPKDYLVAYLSSMAIKSADHREYLRNHV